MWTWERNQKTVQIRNPACCVFIQQILYTVPWFAAVSFLKANVPHGFQLQQQEVHHHLLSIWSHSYITLVTWHYPEKTKQNTDNAKPKNNHAHSNHTYRKMHTHASKRPSQNFSRSLRASSLCCSLCSWLWSWWRSEVKSSGSSDLFPAHWTRHSSHSSCSKRVSVI